MIHINATVDALHLHIVLTCTKEPWTLCGALRN